MYEFCKHRFESFNYNPFGEDEEPTEKQINEYKLYKCKDCDKWYSLIGVVIGE